MNIIQFLFSFHGRINRAKYWLFVLGVWVWIFVSVTPLLRTFSVSFEDNKSESQIAIAIIVIFGWWLALIYISVAVMVKRLHDRGRSGWLLLLFFSLALVLGLLEKAGDIAGDYRGSGVTLGGLIFMIWQIIELGCLRGTRGPNRYGPDPLGGGVSPTLGGRPGEPTPT